jgi:hypothetical protein
VDYKKLNNISVKNKFPLPIIDEFLDEIAGAQYFTTIDLASGFHQIRMSLRMKLRQHLRLTMTTFNSELCHLACAMP